MDCMGIVFGSDFDMFYNRNIGGVFGCTIYNTDIEDKWMSEKLSYNTSVFRVK